MFRWVQFQAVLHCFQFLSSLPLDIAWLIIIESIHIAHPNTTCPWAWWPWYWTRPQPDLNHSAGASHRKFSVRQVVRTDEIIRELTVWDWTVLSLTTSTHTEIRSLGVRVARSPWTRPWPPRRAPARPASAARHRPNACTRSIAGVPNNDPLLGDRSRHSTSIYRCLWLDERGNRVHVEEEIDERACGAESCCKGTGSLDWLGFFTGLLTKATDGGRPTLG
jgi:hypothetical protein